MLRKKVAIIGIDGMYPNLLEKILRKGLMPYLSEKIRDSLHGTLKSTIPPYTPTAWTSISTGVSPVKHGIYGFFVRKSDIEVRLANASDIRYPRIWEMLSIMKKHSVVINIPLIHPFNKMIFRHGDIIITGWNSPVKAIFPSSLRSLKLLDMLAESSQEFRQISRYSPQRYIKAIEQMLEIKILAIRKLLKMGEWSLFYIILSETDWLMHKFVSLHEVANPHKFKRIFRIIDKLIAIISNNVDLTIICSDHGFKCYRRTLYVNMLLSKLGYLKVKHQSRALSKLHVLINNPLVRLLLNQPLIRKRIDGARLKIGESEVMHSIIDLRKTIAYSPEYFIIFVRRGYIKQVKESLSKVITVYEPQELYGKKNPWDPELITTNFNGTAVSSNLNRGIIASRRLFVEKVTPHHAPDGIFIAFGDIRSGGAINNISIYDIAPTVLAYLGLPTPHDTDGRVIEKIALDTNQQTNYTDKWRILRRLRAKFFKYKN